MTTVLEPPASPVAPVAPIAPVRLADQLGSVVFQRYAGKINSASTLIDTLIARCHAPHDGDADRAWEAVAVLNAIGEYTYAKFADDCNVSIRVRNAIPELDAVESEWSKLEAERVGILKHFEALAKSPTGQLQNILPQQRRLVELDQLARRLGNKHEGLALAFKNLCAQSERVFRALKNAGVDLRNR